MKPRSYSLAIVAFGAFMAVHCFRAGRTELRAGVADVGEWGQYPRGHTLFWPIIVLNSLASVMGAFFFAFGADFAVSMAVEMTK
jgi:hypothetical protein